MTKTPLKVQVPDVDYWKKQIKCQDACPVHTDARGYVRALAQGNFEQAYLIARAPNPLASICGRVCGAPCEAACRRGTLDQSISIRALKRSAIEIGRGDLKAIEVVDKIRDNLSQRDCSDIEDLGNMLMGLDTGKIKKIEGKTVGIIGSGPAGLAVAHDLAILGAKVTIYEMEPVPAGMLYLGIPAYRLPRELILAEVEVIKTLGVEIKTNCTIGRDVTLQELRDRHDIVVIAVGMKSSRSLPLPGADAKGVIGGVEFLRDVALNLPHGIGRKVVVLGGGNVAYDVARTALRRQQIDIVGTAYRMVKDVHVTLCCIEKYEQMLADEIEILEGEEEGVHRQNGYGPQEILTENGKVKGVLFHKIISIFDENGRFNPKYDPNDKIILEADTVMWAVGQKSNLTFIDPEKDGIQLDPRGVLVCDKETLESTAKNVYVAGDLAHGARLMIDAIASGKKAARSIYKRLTGEEIKYNLDCNHSKEEGYGRELGYERIMRSALDAVPVRDRITAVDRIVEMGFTKGQAKIEGSRCFDCSVNTVFNGEYCVLCGGCADVCPELCLKLVPVSELNGDKSFDQLTNIMKDKKQTDVLTAIIKDEERCIRCGLCATRCPANAITMERFTFKESIV
ncbi:MAG: FAD-dependent oxidoreductase [Nitrospirae bacterium]|nr:FAD-dependent oxidoreductase [Nitrospirota bacterium]